MATKIRLKRIGRRNRPFYRLIVIDSRKKRDGAAIEQVGWYNPIADENSYDIKGDRVLHWLGEGAIPSDAVKKIMRQEGLSLRWHLMQQGVDEKEIEKEMKKWELNRENVLADREAKKAEKLLKKKEASQAEAAPEAPAEEKAEKLLKQRLHQKLQLKKKLRKLLKQRLHQKLQLKKKLRKLLKQRLHQKLQLKKLIITLKKKNKITKGVNYVRIYRDCRQTTC